MAADRVLNATLTQVIWLEQFITTRAGWLKPLLHLSPTLVSKHFVNQREFHLGLNRGKMGNIIGWLNRQVRILMICVELDVIT